MLRQELAASLRHHQAGMDLLIREYEARYPSDPPDQVRLIQLHHLVSAANRLAPGDYIELGVHVGLTLKLIHKWMDPRRTLFAFDTFQGFDERDVNVERGLYPNNWRVGNFDETSAEAVARYLGNPDNLVTVEGWFPETWRERCTRRWRFAHVDMDLYQPTVAALDRLWPQMVPGGIIAVHDYGNSAFRVRQAVDEFCAKVRVPPVEAPDRWGTAIIRSPL
jgi:hypothetical protein